jgi:hypothetical protein
MLGNPIISSDISTAIDACLHRNSFWLTLTLTNEFAIHEECSGLCRSSIIRDRIAANREFLLKVDNDGNLPLHLLLENKSSSIEDALMMIGKYPETSRHRNHDGKFPLNIECWGRCRSAIISKCIELYPEAIASAGNGGYLPLHRLLSNSSSTIGDALMMMEKYPAILKHRSYHGLPLHIECEFQSRPAIILKCIELYPEALDYNMISYLLNRKVIVSDFHRYADVLIAIFTAHPMSFYDNDNDLRSDVRSDPCYRRRTLNLLPHHIFSPRHESDYRDLNWQPRAAMMMLLLQIKVHPQQQCRRIESNNDVIVGW